MGNLGLLFMLLFFIYAALGVELFGELGKCLYYVQLSDLHQPADQNASDYAHRQ